MLQTLSATYRWPCPVVREPEDDRELEMLQEYMYIPSGQMTPQPRLTQEAQGIPLAAKLRFEHKKVKEEG
jgi:hypothetical protein